MTRAELSVLRVGPNSQSPYNLGLFLCSAGVAGLGHEWLSGRGAKHVKHAQIGVFYVFEGVCGVGEALNTKTSPPGCIFVFKGHVSVRATAMSDCKGNCNEQTHD